MNEAILEQLAAAFELWVREQSLTMASAEELLAKPLTDQQRAWLEVFAGTLVRDRRAKDADPERIKNSS